MNLGLIKSKETVTEKISCKRKQSYSVKDKKVKLQKDIIDCREKVFNYLIKEKMIVKKKIMEVEDEKEFLFDHKRNSN